MSDWKIEVVKANPDSIGTHDLLVSFLESDRAWKRLSKPARAAVQHLANEVEPSVHPNTMHALARHGFVEWDEDGWNLTDAGREVVRWMVRP